MGSPASNENRSGELKPYAALRAEMVERNIAARGVRDELVLDAMRKVPRELFLPKNLREFAYEDSPLPIAGEQTISQPYIVAFMAEALMLKGGEKVLEIGAGSGYAAAVLSEIAANVYTVERLGQLADKAAAPARRTRLRQCSRAARRRHQGVAGACALRCHRRRRRRTAGSGVAEGAIEDRRAAGDPGRRRSAHPGTGEGDQGFEGPNIAARISPTFASSR